PADELALPDDIESYCDDHRHGDRQHLEHDPQDHADRAQRHQPVVQRCGPGGQQGGGIARAHAASTVTWPAPSAAVAPWPDSTQAQPRATRSLTLTCSVAVPAPLRTFA